MGHGFFGIFGAFGIIIFWTVIVSAWMYTVRMPAGPARHGNRTGDPAVEMLRRRFAEGEITALQYGRAMATLNGAENKEGQDG